VNKLNSDNIKMHGTNVNIYIYVCTTRNQVARHTHAHTQTVHNRNCLYFITIYSQDFITFYTP